VLHGTQGRVLELPRWKGCDGLHHPGNIQSGHPGIVRFMQGGGRISAGEVTVCSAVWAS